MTTSNLMPKWKNFYQFSFATPDRRNTLKTNVNNEVMDNKCHGIAQHLEDSEEGNLVDMH